MNFSKQEIIKMFLRNGLQLDNDSLSYFFSNQDKINPFLGIVKNLKEKPLVITKSFVEEIFFQIPKVEILKEFSQPTGIFSSEDILKFFHERYEFFRKILEKRIDLVNLISINRISKKLRKFSIIGMISDKNEEEKSVEVEDLTGTITIFLDEKIFNLLPLDVVIGFVCERKGDRIIAEDVIFPDIPLRKEVSKTTNNVYCLFVSDFHLDFSENYKLFENFLGSIKNLSYPNLLIFFLGDISSRKEDYEMIVENIPKNFSYFFLKGELEKNLNFEKIFDLPVIIKVQNVKIFLAHGDLFSPYLSIFRKPEDTILQLLKLRNFNPTFSLNNFSNNYLLDEIPDIVAVGHFHNPTFQNYKGTTIILNGSFNTQPIFWLINLKTREINKFSLI
jgi:DNA polymerase II small subunit/DNA polymerase delta subunit B